MTETGVVLGLELGGRVARSDAATFTDDGSPIAVLLESQPLAPAGAAGEVVVVLLSVAVTWTMAATISVTPIVDGVEYGFVTDITLLAKTERHTETLEIPLMAPAYRDDGVTEWGRFALRGTWFAVRLETAALAAGELIFESADIEYEVVRESRPAAA